MYLYVCVISREYEKKTKKKKVAGSMRVEEDDYAVKKN